MANRHIDTESDSCKQDVELVFFRDDSFYVVPYPPLPEGKTWQEVAKDSAAVNQGTLKVETIFGEVLWESAK